MSIGTRSIRYAGFGVFRLSCMCCVSVVGSVVEECLALKLCLMSERGMSGVILSKISLSRILRGLQKGY